MEKSAWRPVSSAVAKSDLSSLDQTSSCGERSHPSAIVVCFFVFQSRMTMCSRSDSKPGRTIARYASFDPSCEKTGAVSVAGLLLVSERGLAEPSEGTTQRSRFVDQASVTPDHLRSKDHLRAVPGDCYLLQIAKRLRRRVVGEPLHQIIGSCAPSAEDEQVSARPVVPGVPMAHGELVVRAHVLLGRPPSRAFAWRCHPAWLASG